MCFSIPLKLWQTVQTRSRTTLPGLPSWAGADSSFGESSGTAGRTSVTAGARGGLTISGSGFGNALGEDSTLRARSTVSRFGRVDVSLDCAGGNAPEVSGSFEAGAGCCGSYTA